MRVISGKAKGCKLKTVPGRAVRPITDRVKESLFNIIGPDIQDAAIWDLFAGTGSVGIEALSRGATFGRFSDNDPQAIRVIQQNLKATGLGESAEVLRTDVFRCLNGPIDRQFEYFYIAPPQYQEIWMKTLGVLDTHPEWFGEDAWVIVQIHPVEYIEPSLRHLSEFDRRKYGSTLLVFYECD